MVIAEIYIYIYDNISHFDSYLDFKRFLFSNKLMNPQYSLVQGVGPAGLQVGGVAVQEVEPGLPKRRKDPLHLAIGKRRKIRIGVVTIRQNCLVGELL